MKMTKKERIIAVLNKEKTDRIPASFWRHFYEYETDAESLAGIMVDYQKEMDWDFMKVNFRESYHDEAWGTKYEFYRDGVTKPKQLYYPVKTPDDYNHINVIDPLDSPVLREQLDALHLINKSMGRELFFVMTVFTPFAVILKLVKNIDVLMDHIKNHKDIIHRVLNNITCTFEKFMEEALNAGVSGVFYATRYWASKDYFTEEQFNEFCRPYDMRLLNIVKDCPFNILHICQGNNMLREMADYPVHGFHWDSCDKTNMSLKDGKDIVKGIVMGGINHRSTIVGGTKADCIKEAGEAYNATGGRGWILGAGCTYPVSTPVENLKALRDWGL